MRGTVSTYINRQEFWKFIGCILLAVPMGSNDTIFGVIYQNILVRSHLLNYKGMFVETTIYIRYVMLTIFYFTSMLAIELFYLTKTFHFSDVYLCTYLSVSLTCLWHILDKVQGVQDILALFLR